jgi:hypothetical protein
MAKTKTLETLKNVTFVLAAVAIVLGIAGLYTGAINLGTGAAGIGGAAVGTVAPAQQPGSVVQFTTTTLDFTPKDKFANTDTNFAGTYYDRLPGSTYTAGTTWTVPGKTSITGLPVGQTDFELAFQNSTAAGLVYLEDIKFNLLDSQGHLTPLVPKTVYYGKVGTVFAETRKGGSTNTTIRLAAGETNVDYTLFFRQNTDGASWRKPAVCVFYNVTDFTTIKVKAGGNELPTFPVPTKYSGLTVQGGSAQRCYDLTSLVPSTTENFGDSAFFTQYLRDIQSASADVEFQASQVYPAIPASNVTFRFLGSAKFFAKDGNTIKDAYENTENGIANVTVNIADKDLVVYANPSP